MSRFPAHQAQLAALEARGRTRALSPAQGLDFASNDYLGLAESELLRDAAHQALARGVPLGAGGSRLLRGNHPEFEALETEAAAFFASGAALFMGGGFQGNLALFASLPRAGDLVLHDALIHASAHDGLRHSRAEHRPFRHNDAADARAVLQGWRRAGGTGRIWIAVESLYSMDGDFAPLDALADLARKNDAVLVVDEAHATGLYGHQGRGLSHAIDDVALIALHTCGKALGVSGALITADKVVIDCLINRARPFIYATAPSPLNAALVRASLAALQERPALIARAGALRAHAAKEARDLCGLDPAPSQIIPLPVGDDHEALAMAAHLQAAGFDIRAIRPPTVPKGTARLRISITGSLDPAAITAAFRTIAATRS